LPKSKLWSMNAVAVKQFGQFPRAHVRAIGGAPAAPELFFVPE